jgi:hypothetical protein
MIIARFRELPVGARFNFRAQRYEKVALNIGRDEDRCGNVFHDDTEVSWDRESGERFSVGRQLVAQPPPVRRQCAPRAAAPRPRDAVEYASGVADSWK